MRILKILRCKKGNMIPLAIVIVLVIVLIACAIFEYVRLNIIAQGVRDAMQSAVISVAAENYDDVYAALREGYSGGYSYGGSSWNERLDLSDVYGRLDGLLGLRRESGIHVKYTGDVVEYRLSNLNVNIINAPFAPSDRNAAQKFLAEATIELEVPLSFGWSALPPMHITVKCKAGYTPKF